jgi:hypothetical protein
MSENRQTERWVAFKAAQAQRNKEEHRFVIGAGVMILTVAVACVAILGPFAASLR